ncbi:hypothetical protein CMQ_3473 [Grosmannia clavigera kw1407]|uniref:Galactose oxidase n=1 Tax=Grosmannia clavigera (strain kw1407 / UAMH 11150) TaxID=655863 RepID=F0X8J5_GROCL|nr:uncharacterized protein CMQ_3473 [Grosmannia clavigera kw1407]EFX05404.1 hypothetical protein CMQ_3473 [Grosmannia clavigera kw1407]
MAVLVRPRQLDNSPAATRGQTRARRRTRPPAAQPAVLALFSLPLAALVGASTFSSPSIFPYVPTSLLMPSASDTTSSAVRDISVVYIFSADGTGRVDLLALNVSSTVQAPSVGSGLKTVTQGVPFLPDSGQASITTAFTPWLLSDGSILVLTGDCASDGNSSSSAWTIDPSVDSPTWASTNVSLSSVSSFSAPWFLGGGLAFSSQVAPTVSDPSIYVYGGMCPKVEARDASSSTDWQGNATYSNQMLKLSASSDTYSASPVSSKGPPIAEAGFTMTALDPSLANHSTGIMTQEISAVILGGHTRTAFVNMSTAALWSMPEEAWSFVSIAADSQSSPTVPDSRSGHTTVLSEDGSKLVILGGWVGDVGQAADPQLAVLNMGATYENWQWSVPSTQPSGGGRYGHGAVLLPGNVMMVYGGYNISSSNEGSSSRLVRRDGSSSLSFFNLTSLAWTEEYTNPTYSSAASSTSSSSSSSSSSTSSSSSSSSPTSSTSAKIGLGIGLGLGLPLVFLVLFCCCRSLWRRHLQRRRRIDAVNTLAQDHNQFLAGHDEMLEVGEQAALPTHWAASYTGGHDPYHAVPGGGGGGGGGGSSSGGGDINFRRSLGYESMRGSSRLGASVGSESDFSEKGMYAEEAIATAVIVRKPTRQIARGLYQPTTIADYEQVNSIIIGGRSAGSSSGGDGGDGGDGGVGASTVVAVGPGSIHPIYEADEEEDDGAAIDHRNAVAAALFSVGAGRPTTPSGRSISPETAEEEASQSDPFLTPVAAPRGLFATPGSGGTTGTGGTGTTVQLYPFAYNAPSSEGRLRQGGTTGTSANTGGAVAGQDRDVQEWVSGLEIEDLLFSPPVPGAGVLAASTLQAPSQAAGGAGSSGPPPQQRGRWSPVRRQSHQSRSNNSSPTRGSFLGPAVGVDDEARTVSNLSDRSAFSFLSRTGSSQSRIGKAAAAATAATAATAASSGTSDTTGQSYNTAISGFQTLRTEGPGLLFGTAHGGGGGAGNLAAPQTAYAPVPSPGPGEYGGAAAVLLPGMLTSGYQEHEDENSALTGSPSKSKGRRSMFGSFFRMLSGSGAATAAAAAAALADEQNAFSESSSAQPQLANVRDRAHATLLRRKQGRFDWEADEMRDEETTAVGGLTGRAQSRRVVSMPGIGAGNSAGEASSRTPAVSKGGSVRAAGPVVPASGSVGAGRRDGSGQSDDWDVENAVRMRSVQVMFTVPRNEQLRVVNAEVEDDDDKDDSVAEPGGMTTPPPPMPSPPQQQPRTAEDILRAQDVQLQQMHGALARSRQLLAESTLEPWMLVDKETVEQEAGESSQSKGKQPADSVQAGDLKRNTIDRINNDIDVDWIDAADIPPPTLDSSAVPKPLQPLRSNPTVLPSASALSAKKSSSSLHTPTAKASSGSLSPLERPKSRASAHRLARRSAASLVDPAIPVDLKLKPAGFVMGMVDQIESSSSCGGSRPGSPSKSIRD